MRHTSVRRSSAHVAAIMLAALVGACESRLPSEPASPIGPQPTPTAPVSPGPTPGPTPPTRPAGIYTSKPDGSDPVRVTMGMFPAWSPDGRRIAFSWTGYVMAVNVDGTNEKILAAGSTPSWSPDGSRIAFVNADGIAVMDADGSNARTLVRHDFRDDVYRPWDMGVGKPAWSPDGSVIAFEHLGDGDIQPAQIFLVNADGSNVRDPQTAPERWKYAESDPSWTPNGRLLFWSWGYGIAVVDRAGGLPNAIYADFPIVAYGSRPTMSPNASWILFNKRGYGRPSAPPCSVWIMTAGGLSGQEIAGDGCDASWSPDGARIVFSVGKE